MRESARELIQDVIDTQLQPVLDHAKEREDPYTYLLVGGAIDVLKVVLEFDKEEKQEEPPC